MKKILGLLLILFVVSGCTSEVVLSDRDDYETAINSEHVSQITIAEAIHFIDEGGTGIILFSRSTCPWCQRAVPIFMNVVNKENVNVLYVDTNTIYDWESWKKEIISRAEAVLETCGSYNDNNELTVYIPFVLVVKEGECIDGHIGTLDDDTLDTKMDDIAKLKLADIYTELINKIQKG